MKISVWITIDFGELLASGSSDIEPTKSDDVSSRPSNPLSSSSRVSESNWSSSPPESGLPGISDQ